MSVLMSAVLVLPSHALPPSSPTGSPGCRCCSLRDLFLHSLQPGRRVISGAALLPPLDAAPAHHPDLRAAARSRGPANGAAAARRASAEHLVDEPDVVAGEDDGAGVGLKGACQALCGRSGLGTESVRSKIRVGCRERADKSVSSDD
jgi:hypothetical protein